jgi:hypothetical protein
MLLQALLNWEYPTLYSDIIYLQSHQRVLLLAKFQLNSTCVGSNWVSISITARSVSIWTSPSVSVTEMNGGECSIWSSEHFRSIPNWRNFRSLLASRRANGVSTGKGKTTACGLWRRGSVGCSRSLQEQRRHRGIEGLERRRRRRWRPEDRPRTIGPATLPTARFFRKKSIPQPSSIGGVWLKDGDRNTAFFQAKAKERAKTNKIAALQREDGAVVTEQEDLEECAVDFYQNLWGWEGSVYDGSKQSTWARWSNRGFLPDTLGYPWPKCDWWKIWTGRRSHSFGRLRTRSPWNNSDQYHFAMSYTRSVQRYWQIGCVVSWMKLSLKNKVHLSQGDSLLTMS